MLLGELLVQEGVLTPEALAEALQAQVCYGARLGTNLVEAKKVDLDTLARLLAKQHGVPAALDKHFASIVPATVALMPAALAAKHGAVPLGAVAHGGKNILIVAMLDPKRAGAAEEIARVVGMPVQAAAAPELRIRYHLERCYRIARQNRFLRVERPAPGAQKVERRAQVEPNPPITETPGGRFEIDSGLSGEWAAAEIARTTQEVTAATLAAAAKAAGVAPVGAAMVAPPAPAPPAPAPPAPAAPPAPLPATAMPTLLPSTVKNPAPAPLGTAPAAPAAPRALPPIDARTATALLAGASARDDVGDLLTRYLRSAFGCGLVLICREGMALGWKGFGSGVEASVIESIAVPLSVPSMFGVAHDRRSMLRGAPPPEGAVLQTRLWKLLKCNPPTETLVLPIVLKERVVNLVYAHATDGGAVADPLVNELGNVCRAAAGAFENLIKKQKKA